MYSINNGCIFLTDLTKFKSEKYETSDTNAVSNSDKNLVEEGEIDESVLGPINQIRDTVLLETSSEVEKRGFFHFVNYNDKG